MKRIPDSVSYKDYIDRCIKTDEKGLICTFVVSNRYNKIKTQKFFIKDEITNIDNFLETNHKYLKISNLNLEFIHINPQYSHNIESTLFKTLEQSPYFFVDSSCC